MDQRL
jgi:serine/threonine protein kinase